MGTRPPPAIRHDEIVAAIATLQAELAALHGMLKRIEGKVIEIDTAVNGKGGHAEQINAWRRDGKWLAAALTGLGMLGATILTHVFDWFSKLPRP